jgi:hypothetical protein
VPVANLLGGGLGRLVVPGRNPMSLGLTIAVGLGGSFLGGLLGILLFGAPGGVILAVLCAAAMVWFIDPRRGTNRI